jgi:carboxypeptidase C (cathepsin A)
MANNLRLLQMKSAMRCAQLILIALALQCGLAAWADDALVQTTSPDPLIAPVTSQHHIHVNGVDIRYRAAWWETVLKDESGVPQATISATSYVREDVGDRPRRPVMFAFNGGPGASSSPLHFGLLGPRMLTPPDSKGARNLLDNSETLLDAVDLVFIDPVGTGFSRELRPDGGKAYWSPAGDSKAVQVLVRDWLRDTDRTNSPIYFAGESYGGYRLAEMAKDIGDLNVAGLILISPSMDRSGTSGVGNDQPFIFNLPSMATTAFAQGKYQGDARTVEQVFEEARVFAQGDYVVALQQGEQLPPAERDRIAARMSKLIGLPAATIAAANLRIGSQDFLEQLVPGKIVGRIDTRVLAPRPDGPLVAGRDKAADDPALNMGASNVKKSAGIGNYLRNEVGVKTDLDYISLTLDVNFAWNWNSGSPKAEDNAYFNITPNITKLMKQRTDSRLLLIGGYYDLATPALAPRYELTHAGVPLDRTTIRDFAAGHAPYDSVESRKLVSAEIHDFVTKGRLGAPESR